MKIFKMIKNNKSFSTILILTLIIWAISISLFLIANNVTKRALIDAEAKRAQEHYENVIYQIVEKLDHIAIFTETIGVDNLTEENFELFALQNDMSNIGYINFSIAPNGIQEYFYSVEPDEFIAGHNLLTDDRDYVREAVEYAIINDVVVINGPYELRQGGEGIIFRKAVYEDDNFVALVNLVIDFDELKLMLEDTYSDTVDIGVYDSNNDLLFGNLEYDSGIAHLEDIEIIGVDWKIGVEVTDSYRTTTNIINIAILATSTSLYLFAVYIGVKFYINNKKLLVNQEKLIFFDNLTSLPNRRLLTSDIEEAIKSKEPFYLGFGDLDNFKNLNDILGHSVGDSYLKDISDRFHELSNELITIYRWGGDEFIFLFRTKTKAETIKLLNKVYKIFKKPIILKDTNYNVSMSIGVVNYPKHGDTIDDLIKRADIVMYDIKSQSKNTYGFFEDKYLDNLQREVDFENKLNKYSLEDFEVYLQPILNVKTNEIVGFEALSRLFDTDGNLINTTEVIKVYERKGEVFKLDKYTIEETCKYSIELKKEFNKEFSFSFNISPITLSNEYITFLKKMIKKYDIDPKFFVIEIIETTGFKDIDESVRLLNKLRNIGFRIAMDDFGMGFSSLSYITRLPLSLIKIDRIFIQNYQTNEFDKMLILTIRDISRSLNIEVVVEGIETEEQLSFIKEIGAHYYQGYLHSRPMSFEKIKKLIK